ncbi:cholesterol 7-alpha-monooxygenase [Rhypophila sp. PSN 637]
MEKGALVKDASPPTTIPPQLRAPRLPAAYPSGPFLTITMDAEQHDHLSLSKSLALFALLAISVRFLFWMAPNHDRNKTRAPPMLSDPIPYITNTFSPAQHRPSKNTNIFGFHLGPKTVYVISGAQNIQSLFRTSPNISFESFFLMAMETLWLATPDDLAKFRNDKSGRAATPASGTAPEKRYWHGLHSLMHKYLEQKKYSDSLAQTYQRFFTSRLVSPFSVVGEWTEVRIVRLMKSEMAYSAIASLLGTRILDTIPNLVDLAWDYDKVLANLLYGAPRWLFPGAHAAQRRILSACTRYYRDTSAEYDWDADEDEVDWEPLFGSRWGRETARWMRECEFDNKTCGGLLGTTGMMGLNASTVPITGWLVMELVKDPELFRVIRAEAETAYVTTESGERILDVQKSLYTEGLRVHVSFNISREVVNPVDMGGYTLPAKSIIQAPTGISHLNEQVWGVEGHPANEFWAYRNVRFVEQGDRKVPVFEMRGRPTDFFPYGTQGLFFGLVYEITNIILGGGIAICPGRNFAKQEIILTIAMLASRFDMEFVRWEKMDGTRSDREARGDPKYAGAAGMPPDRDMRVRWKRLW